MKWYFYLPRGAVHEEKCGCRDEAAGRSEARKEKEKRGKKRVGAKNIRREAATGNCCSDSCRGKTSVFQSEIKFPVAACCCGVSAKSSRGSSSNPVSTSNVTCHLSTAQHPPKIHPNLNSPYFPTKRKVHAPSTDTILCLAKLIQSDA